MGLSKSIITYAAIAIFTLAIFGFGYGLQRLNDVDDTILNDSTMSGFESDITVVVNDTSGEMQNLSDATSTESSKIPVGDIISNPLWGSAGKFMRLSRATANALGEGIRVYIGVDPMVISLVLAIAVLIGIVFGWWKLIKSGQD